MRQRVFHALLATATPLLLLATGGCQATGGQSTARSAPAGGTPRWTSWRGPQQDGTSMEKGLPAKVAVDAPGSWSYALAGRGTPVVHEGHVYTMGYEGTDAELQEVLVCLDEKTGKRIWEHRYSDFLSDVIYYRFSIGSPTVDPRTGRVYCTSSAGLLSCFDDAGKLLWEHSLMSEYGRMTFPNGRTGAPLVDGDLCIVHMISASWGPNGPARDRFHAFDKGTGEPIWTSTPGGQPTDSSFSFPVVGYEHGHRVLYAALGGGHVVCVDVRTGDPIWSFLLATGGLSSSVLKYKDTIIAVNGKENAEESTIGCMVAIRCGGRPDGPGKGPKELDKAEELWRNDIVSFTSSPILVGNRVYQTDQIGELCCVNADNGEVKWRKKLAPDQIHASPAWGDGKLYVPMNNGSFYIIEPGEKDCEVKQKLQLDGACLGAPAICNGRVYVHTTARLYCFGGGSGEIGSAPPLLAAVEEPDLGKPVRLQVLPADITVATGNEIHFRVRSLDAFGRVVAESVPGVTFKNVPAGGVELSEAGVMTIPKTAHPSASMMVVEANGLKGMARVRIVPSVPFTDDFADAALKPDPKSGVASAPSRPWWVGAGPKWEILELDGDKVLAKTLTNPLFQRATSMIGSPDSANYTMEADVRADGNRRIMPFVGLVNQRYLIMLKGNHQEIEVSSNMELFRYTARFAWKPHVWYRLKSRVDVSPDGSGVVRAKAWPRDEPEPKGWTIEVPHTHAHTHGAPGIYGFALQSRFRVYIDNIKVTPND